MRGSFLDLRKSLIKIHQVGKLRMFLSLSDRESGAVRVQKKRLSTNDSAQNVAAASTPDKSLTAAGSVKMLLAEESSV